MSEVNPELFKCQRCGHELATDAEVCAACGAAKEDKAGSGSDPVVDDDWATVGRSLKTRWVAAVLAFWVSTVILVIVFFIEGQLNLILISICLGLMIVGVWLKTRYQLHLRKEPGRR